MLKRLSLLLVSLLVLGFTVAGCGDDDEDSGSSGGGDTSAQEEKGSDKSGGGGNAAPGIGGEASKQAAETCKKSVNSQPGLSSGVKKDLEEICEEAADGDEAAVRKASKDVCKRIVEETAPEGPAREQALTACDQAGATP